MRVTVSIGELSKKLYARETDEYAQTESGIKLCFGDQSAPLVDVSSLSAAERASLHLVATLPSLPTFLHVIALVRRGLSLSQVASVIQHERDIIPEVKKCMEAVNRREETLSTRLIAVMGLLALSNVLSKCWSYSLAADASAQIEGTLFFAILVRLPPLRPSAGVTTLHVAAPPLLGSHTGEAIMASPVCDPST